MVICLSISCARGCNAFSPVHASRRRGCAVLAAELPKVTAIAAKLRAVHPGPGLPPVIRASQLDLRSKVVTAPAASPVQVVDVDTGEYLGWGLWNPHTHQFRVRVLEAGQHIASKTIADVSDALDRRIIAAARLRRSILGFPSEETNVFRLVNREGDHLSGLAVDVLGQDLVVRSSSLWVEIHRALIEKSLRASWQFSGRLLWQREADSLVQDGFKAYFNENPSAESSAASSPVLVRECGVRFAVDPGQGKKTGHFADQRENRHRLRELVQAMVHARSNSNTLNGQGLPLRILDLFCYSGGFALNAAMGASGHQVHVIAVDMAESAVNEAERNIVENGVTDIVKVVHANAFTFLQDEAKAGNSYDIVVCDPPRASYGSSWSQDELKNTIGYHRRVTRRCLQVMRKGSILVTCTCSQVMTEARTLLLAVMQAAATEGRTLRLLHRTGCGGDHPLHPAWRPGGHLEVLWLEVD